MTCRRSLPPLLRRGGAASDLPSAEPGTRPTPLLRELVLAIKQADPMTARRGTLAGAEYARKMKREQEIRKSLPLVDCKVKP